MPLGITFELWAESLIVDFPQENIPLYIKGQDWRLWADFIAELTTFADNNTPGSLGFKTPILWAKAVYNNMVNFV